LTIIWKQPLITSKIYNPKFK